MRTALFAALFIGAVLLYIPYWLASGGAPRLDLGPWRYAGLLPVVVGSAGIAWCLRDFSVVGRGTPAPFDPPRQLVVTGPYQYVRNPMYVSALLVLIGEAILLEAPVLLRYAAALFIVVHLFVVFYEEPTLQRTFGESYERYRQSVPRWLPRRVKGTG
ncbi:MAG TPA: isoprenylcysteine carboxylmethyltransferase family protein [Gemmatimonadales bacterium]|nr:isoprenylcysteine carboxylmethyltransferase family protein [Gemmatimonadales bacterium]